MSQLRTYRRTEMVHYLLLCAPPWFTDALSHTGHGETDARGNGEEESCTRAGRGIQTSEWCVACGVRMMCVHIALEFVDARTVHCLVCVWPCLLTSLPVSEYMQLAVLS